MTGSLASTWLPQEENSRAVERERSAAKNRTIKIAKVFLAKEQVGRIMCFLFGGEVADDSRLTCAIPEYQSVFFAGLIALGAV